MKKIGNKLAGHREKDYLIGIDEVGRGPLAGPITVGVFAIRAKDAHRLDVIGAKDSKVLSVKKREAIDKNLRALARAGFCSFQITSVSAHVIDTKGLTYAITSVITSGLKRLAILDRQADIYLDGGLRAPNNYVRQQTIIKGDGKIPVISCASVLAKVARDKFMTRQDKKFPDYGFAQHKGYGTPEHYRAIKKQGITELHRKSFLKNLEIF